MAMVLSARRSSPRRAVSPRTARGALELESSWRELRRPPDHSDMIAAAVTGLTLAEPLPRRLSALSGPQNFTLERVGGVNYGEELYRVASLASRASVAANLQPAGRRAARPR